MRDRTGLFITEREIQFINNNTMELIESIVAQSIIYYPIDNDSTQSDELYGESTKKIFRDPIELYCRVLLDKHDVKTGDPGYENFYEVEFYFQRDRVIQDLGFYPRAGDYAFWNEKYFEIKTVTEPQLFGGLSQYRIGIICKAIIARQEVFNTFKNKPYNPTVNPDSSLKSE